MYFAPGSGASVLEVDGRDVRGGQNSQMQGNVTGLTLGNHYGRGFSTTDHQFVFLGMREGPMSSAEKQRFWNYVAGL